MRISLATAFILHQRPYRESSLLLEVFSRDHGRITLVAKGVRSNRKKSQALYQSHRQLNISWSGRGDMGTLTEIEANGPGFKLHGQSVLSAFYINELLVRLLHRHEAHPQLFDAYFKALTRLEHGESELLTLRYFEKHLLDSIGYGLVLDHELGEGSPIDPQRRYFYCIDEGPYTNAPGGSTYVEISGRTLLALDREELEESACVDEAKQLMRLTLNGYLGEKPLASRDLFKAYARQKQKHSPASSTK